MGCPVTSAANRRTLMAGKGCVLDHQLRSIGPGLVCHRSDCARGCQRSSDGLRGSPNASLLVSSVGLIALSDAFAGNAPAAVAMGRSQPMRTFSTVLIFACYLMHQSVSATAAAAQPTAQSGAATAPVGSTPGAGGPPPVQGPAAPAYPSDGVVVRTPGGVTVAPAPSPPAPPPPASTANETVSSPTSSSAGAGMLGLPATTSESTSENLTQPATKAPTTEPWTLIALTMVLFGGLGLFIWRRRSRSGS